MKGKIAFMKWTIGLLSFGLLLLIFWALLDGNFFLEGGQLLRSKWGLVALADLYLGFFLFSLFIFWIEEKRVTAAIVTALLFVLGNWVAGIWLVYRFPLLRIRLKKMEVK